MYKSGIWATDVEILATAKCLTLLYSLSMGANSIGIHTKLNQATMVYILTTGWATTSMQFCTHDHEICDVSQ